MNKVYSLVRVYYQNLLKKHLLATQSIQTGILISAGDILAQTAMEKKRISEINLSRTSKYFIIGVGLVVSTVVKLYIP